MSYTVRFEWNDGPQALINQAHLFLESIALNYLSRKINWKMIAWLLNVARRKTQSLFRNEPAEYNPSELNSIVTLFNFWNQKFNNNLIELKRKD